MKYVQFVKDDKADHDKMINFWGGTIVETYRYIGLEPGHTYRLDTWTKDQTGQHPSIKAQTPFVADASGSGYVTLELTVPDDFAGANLQILHAVYDGTQSLDYGGTVANYISVQAHPVVSTTSVNKVDGTRVFKPGGGTVAETVTYANLQPYKEYRLVASLYDWDAQLPSTTKAETVFFTDGTGAGRISLDIPFDARWNGKAPTVEALIYEGERYISSVNNTSDRVYIHTETSGYAVDRADGDKVLPSYGGVIKETFSYTNLVPRKWYRVDVCAADTGRMKARICVSPYFQASPTGYGTLPVDLTVGQGYSGTTLNILEHLYDGTAGVGGNYAGSNQIRVA